MKGIVENEGRGIADYGRLCEHTYARDYFSELPGVRRTTPGNVYYPKCKQHFPMRWNNGNPVVI